MWSSVLGTLPSFTQPADSALNVGGSGCVFLDKYLLSTSPTSKSPVLLLGHSPPATGPAFFILVVVLVQVMMVVMVTMEVVGGEGKNLYPRPDLFNTFSY